MPIELLTLLSLFAYSALIFFIDNIYLLIAVFIFNVAISLIIKTPFPKHIAAIGKNIKFTIFIIVCNMLFSDISASLKVGLRLFLAIDYTYIIGNYFSPTKIKIALKHLFYPLKLFKVNTNDLTLSVAISLAFIPILIDEATMIKTSLRNKGINFKFGGSIIRPHIYLITFLNNLFNRLDDLEKTLIIKAY